MNRVLASAAIALAALAAGGCQPPTERSGYNNSGLSVAVASNPAVAPPASPNPPPRIDTPPDAMIPGAQTGPAAASGAAPRPAG